MALVGGWELVEMKACNLPEDAATGFTQATQSLVGATYVPVLYVGKQIVPGVNHMIICKQTLAVKDATEHLVELVINSGSVVSIKQIV